MLSSNSTILSAQRRAIQRAATVTIAGLILAPVWISYIACRWQSYDIVSGELSTRQWPTYLVIATSMTPLAIAWTWLRLRRLR